MHGDGEALIRTGLTPHRLSFVPDDPVAMEMVLHTVHLISVLKMYGAIMGETPLLKEQSRSGPGPRGSRQHLQSSW